jgi:hypothetical protein
MVRDQNWKDTHTGIPDISTEMPVGSTVDMTTDTVNWYEDPDLEIPITEAFTLTEDKTIYAGAVLTLVYDPLYRWTGEGTPDVTIVMPIGTKVDMTTLTIPGHEGDDPVSWTTESGVADTVITEPFVMYENKTIYAKATISGGGGDDNTKEEETKAEIPTEPAKETTEETPTESKKETVAGSNETYTSQTNTQQNTIQETSTPDTIDGNVSTGDQSNVTLWFTVLMLSCMGIVAVTIYKKKRR